MGVSQRGYARCRACNTRFYPQWRERFKKFEDMCFKCLPKVDIALMELEQETSFVKGYIQDKKVDDLSDLYKEDVYLEALDEDTFSEWSLFEGR